jgi:CheY-like chemotaxis protein
LFGAQEKDSDVSTFSRLSVLIVDDNSHMRRILHTPVHGFGFVDVREAADGAEALDLMKAREYDILLCDISMEPLDGIELTTMLRRSTDSPAPMQSIIMITGHTERNKVDAARGAGVNEFVAKPVTALALLQQINEVILRPRAFIRTVSYFGPDRRRRNDPNYNGKMRRATDTGDTYDLG